MKWRQTKQAIYRERTAIHFSSSAAAAADNTAPAAGTLIALQSRRVLSSISTDPSIHSNSPTTIPCTFFHIQHIHKQTHTHAHTHTHTHTQTNTHTHTSNLS